MSVVIDLNVFSAVFDDTCAMHGDFSAVKQWIEKGWGFLVYGGTKYKRELSFRRMRLVRRMREAGQAVAIKDDVVDQIALEVENKTAGTECNDQHIIALLAAARCSLLCSNDAESFRFIKDKGLYPKPGVRVRIISSNKNADLLVKMDRNKLANVVA